MLVDKTDDPVVRENYVKALGLVSSFLGLKDTRLSADGKRVYGSVDGNGRVIIGPIRETKQKFYPWVDLTLKERNLNDNPLERQTTVREFLINLNKGISEALDSSSGANRSAILFTLDEASKIMANVAAETKVLLILSDMMENSEVITFYKLSPGTDAKKVFEQVKSKVPVPNLKGVNIYVLSSTRAIDSLSSKIEEFWKLYFIQSRGSLKQYSVYLPGPLD